MDAWPQIATALKCQQNAERFCWAEAQHRERPHRQCLAIAQAHEGGHGPNLLLWNGSTHQLVISLKDDLPDPNP